ncbi:hypothetical protein GFER_11510 [Geoalkalibacter ferrihydriticus DSM 17813]|uniref:Uncharacterized protein n=2 Tax=Geoalkalibacter ferrihydriticus TaxID=392333 RepID=A0A0C2HU50_9BACT|nr:hypothetical protein GFER_11510 [Geoalkalibacter ferrihydriticus DSM 17813]
MDEGIRWEASKRLEFIDFRLYWEGRVNRGDLTDFFGISIPQASNDLSKYQELAPRNLDYDRSGKFYFATQEFKPVFYEPTSDDYLSQLKQISSGLITQNESIIKSVPDTYLIPVLERKLPNDTLKTIIHSLKNKTDLNVFYQSMSRQDPSWRWIAPKSLAYDGFRWHIRSYCFTRKDFRDFAIGRIWEIKAQRPTEAEEKEDNEWNTFITLKIGPNPNLSENQKNTIEMEYGMENGFKEVYVRQSLLSYFLRRYGLDHKCAQDEMAGQHIVLLNAESIPDNYKPIGF